MTATTKRRATSAKKATKAKTKATYSPWVQRMVNLAEPLTGKLTKAINSKVIYFLDTNVLMHFANDQVRRDKIAAKLDKIGRDSICVSSITLYEVHTKLIKNKVSKANVDRLAAIVATFKVRNFNSAAAIAAAKVRAQLENEGEGIGHPDQLIAGHAKSEKATLVTNNTEQMKRVHGLKIEDWTA